MEGFYLIGDIGGTTTRLTLADDTTREFDVVRFDSRRYDGLAEIVEEFRRSVPHVSLRGACFAVAGPVVPDGAASTVALTNLTWSLHSEHLAAQTGLPYVGLINDFEAVGYALRALRTEDYLLLQSGHAVPGAPRAVIGAGTGLGQAIVLADGERDIVVPTEGGHTDFAAADATQWELAQWCIGQLGRVSYEDLLSGPGLARIYAFVTQRAASHTPPTIDLAHIGYDPAQISHNALVNRDPLAMTALEILIDIYGRQAGNLALTAGATGGLYIAGGIAPRVADALSDGRFIRAFNRKGPMTGWMKRVPVHLITRPEPGLLGALHYARQHYTD